MRNNDSPPPGAPPADTTGTGPTRSKPAGPGFHPYARN